MVRGFLFVAASACAAVAHAQATGVRWQAAAEVRHRALTEWTEGGARLLAERGSMTHVELAATLDRPGWPVVMARAAWAQGRLDYEGQSQAGVPLASTSRHGEGEMGLHWRAAASPAWGEIWLGVDWLRQRRDIASTAVAGGLGETSTLALPGLRWRSAGFSLPALHAITWQLEGQWRTSARNRLSVDYLGAYDSSTFGSGHREEAALRLVASSGNRWHWSLGFSRARQAASGSAVLRSDGAAVGSVREPAMRIDDVSLSVAREF